VLDLRDLGVRAALACPAREAVCLRLQFADASFSPIDILASCRTPERSRARANVKHGPGLQMGIVAQSSPCGYPPTHVRIRMFVVKPNLFSGITVPQTYFELFKDITSQVLEISPPRWTPQP